MREYYIEKIAVCQNWITFFEEEPSWRETKSMVTGGQRIEDAEWLNADHLIAIERRRIVELQGYLSLYD